MHSFENHPKRCVITTASPVSWKPGQRLAAQLPAVLPEKDEPQAGKRAKTRDQFSVHCVSNVNIFIDQLVNGLLREKRKREPVGRPPFSSMVSVSDQFFVIANPIPPGFPCISFHKTPPCPLPQSQQKL